MKKCEGTPLPPILVIHKLIDLEQDLGDISQTLPPPAEHKKMDADLMDEKRKEHIAYEYLCHLEEAKK